MVRRTLLLVFFLCAYFSCFAQSWSEMTRWVETRGKYKLAEIAHPSDYANDRVLGYSVSSSSSSITVRVRYQGWTGAYTDTYEIVKGVYDGQPYFRKIRVDEPYDPLFSAFNAIDNFGIGYENAYYRMEAAFLYGDEKYNYLSKYEKAAFILFTLFLEDYYDD